MNWALHGVCIACGQLHSWQKPSPTCKSAGMCTSKASWRAVQDRCDLKHPGVSFRRVWKPLFLHCLVWEKGGSWGSSWLPWCTKSRVLNPHRFKPTRSLFSPLYFKVLTRKEKKIRVVILRLVWDKKKTYSGFWCLLSCRSQSLNETLRKQFAIDLHLSIYIYI